MPKYSPATPDVTELLNDLLFRFSGANDEMYQRIIDAKLKIQMMFAYGDRDENGTLTGDAITHNGHQAIGLCENVPLKLRARGLSDACITLDHDWWVDASDEARESLVDHELFHIKLKFDKDGRTVKRDDLGRPMLEMRKHDIEIGMFSKIAARHGREGIERKHFRAVVDSYGQYLMPEMFEGVALDEERIEPRGDGGTFQQQADAFITKIATEKGLKVHRNVSIEKAVDGMAKVDGKGGSVTISVDDHEPIEIKGRD